LRIIVQCNLDAIQGDVASVVVSAMFFFAVEGVFEGVSVCIVDVSSWFELVERVCEVGVSVDEECKCKHHNKVEARLMLRLQQA